MSATNPITGAQRKPAERALSWVRQERWAILEESLEMIMAVASRDQADVEAVMAKRGAMLEEDSSAQVRGSTAVIPVTGPIFRYANLFTMLSGATSVDQVASDIRAANENPLVRTIVLEINSPGGMLTGTSELAQLIKASPKRVIAYVDGMAASAAYWLASAADEIVMNDTAQVGSIGVVSTYSTEEDPTRVEIVSSQSPWKRPDVRTDEGRAHVQALTDQLANVFIDTVAANRNVDRITVLTEFGAGALKVGKSAVEAGMADRIGSLEGLLTELAGPASTGTRSATMTMTKKGPVTVSTTAELQNAVKAGHTIDEISVAEPDLAAVRAEGAAAERERIQSVESQAIPGHEKLIAALKFDGKTTGPEAAVQVLQAERAQRGKQVSAMVEDAGQVSVPAAAAPAAPDTVDKTLPLEERCAAEWRASPELRAEFDDLDQYTAYARANESGKVRVLKK